MLILTLEKLELSNISHETASKRLLPVLSLIIKILKVFSSFRTFEDSMRFKSALTTVSSIDPKSIEFKTLSLPDPLSIEFKPSLLNSSLDNRLSIFSETKYGLFSEISSLFLSEPISSTK